MGQGRALIHGCDVDERLRTDLPDAFAGDERVGLLLAGDGLRDAHHESSIGHDAQGAGNVEYHSALHVGERHEVEPGVVLVGVESLGELLCLFAGASLHERERVEVHEDRSTSPSQHPPCGDGRIYAAGHHDGDLPRRADGQTARTGVVFRVDERVLPSPPGRRS